MITNGSPAPLKELFTSFWAALDGRALSALDRTSASSAFLSSVLESLVFLARRLGASAVHDRARLVPGENGRGTQELVREQVRIAWDELRSGRLRVVGSTVGALFVRTLGTLYALDAGVYLRVMVGCSELNVLDRFV